jgi:hypothetical protein
VFDAANWTRIMITALGAGAMALNGSFSSESLPHLQRAWTQQRRPAMKAPLLLIYRMSIFTPRM